MGVDWTSYAVLGVRVPRHLFYRKQVARAFEHDRPASEKFCPQTGRALWQPADMPPPGYDDRNDTFHGWKVAHGGDSEAPGDIYIGIVAEADYQGDPMKSFAAVTPEKVVEMRHKLSGALITSGLWSPEQGPLPFGLWAVLYCSC